MSLSSSSSAAAAASSCAASSCAAANVEDKKKKKDNPQQVTTTATSPNKEGEEEPWKKLVETWLAEQLEVAKQVIVLPDDNDNDDNGVADADVAVPSRMENGGRFVARRLELGRRRRQQGDPCDSGGGIYYGGVDVSFAPQPPSCNTGSEGGTNPQQQEMAIAVYVILEVSFSSQEEDDNDDDCGKPCTGSFSSSCRVIYQTVEYFPLTVPYISSFLAFRERDPLIRLIRQQQQEHPAVTPAAILVDGNGRYHPRGAGLACFVGVATGIPTIGVGKKLQMQGGLSHTLVNRAMDDALERVVESWLQTPPSLTTTSADTKDFVLFDTQPVRGQWGQPSTTTDIARDKDHDDAMDLEMKIHHDDNDNNKSRRRYLVQQLSIFSNARCRGLAIPLEAVLENHDSLTTTRTTTTIANSTDYQKLETVHGILAYALIGHGGGRAQRPSSSSPSSPQQRIGGKKQARQRATPGTVIPLFVSVGHSLSLSSAVTICATLCTESKIPEPVRQADLLGRAWMRQEQQRRHVLPHDDNDKR